MFNLDAITDENNKDQNKRWPYISDHPYRMLIIGSSGSGKTNALLNLINKQDNYNPIDQIYFHAKDLSEPKYQFLTQKREDVGIIFDDMIADVTTSKRFQAIIKELFIRCRKLNISLVFITQSYFTIPKEVRLNSTQYLIMKIHNKRELQNIAFNHSVDIDYKDFMKFYRKCTKNDFLF